MGSNVLKPGINDLRTVNPPLAAEWDTERNGGLRPEDVMAGSEKKPGGNAASATAGGQPYTAGTATEGAALFAQDRKYSRDLTTSRP